MIKLLRKRFRKCLAESIDISERELKILSQRKTVGREVVWDKSEISLANQIPTPACNVVIDESYGTLFVTKILDFRQTPSQLRKTPLIYRGLFSSQLWRAPPNTEGLLQMLNHFLRHWKIPPDVEALLETLKDSTRKVHTHLLFPGGVLKCLEESFRIWRSPSTLGKSFRVVKESFGAWRCPSEISYFCYEQCVIQPEFSQLSEGKGWNYYDKRWWETIIVFITKDTIKHNKRYDASCICRRRTQDRVL